MSELVSPGVITFLIVLRMLCTARIWTLQLTLPPPFPLAEES